MSLTLTTYVARHARTSIYNEISRCTGHLNESICEKITQYLLRLSFLRLDCFNCNDILYFQESNEPLKWRVENSWGEDRNEKGYLVMTNDWFREFVYEVVVDKSICSEEILKVFETEPIILPAWDPMGALAK